MSEHTDLRVADLMTRSVFTLKATQSLPLAESLMRNRRIRHVPVVDDEGALVGLVTHRDLLAAQISALAPLSEDERSSLQLSVPVSRVMRTTVWTIGSDALALSAARTMTDHQFGCLPVVDEGVLVGIICESDLLATATAILGSPRPARPWRVDHAMTPAPITIGPDTTLDEARAAMTRYGIRHLPIAEGGRPISMISDRDLRVAEVVFRDTQHASALRAGRVVASDPVRCVARDARLDVVLLDMFAERLDAVLVVDGERLVGVLAASDACRILGERLRRDARA